MLKNSLELPVIKADMKMKLTEIIDKLTEDQLEHFSYALQQIANCYLNSTSHGALLVANESDESQSLVAINASENQISEMVVFMADAMQSHQPLTGGMYVN
jgi:hypothetical protein